MADTRKPYPKPKPSPGGGFEESPSLFISKADQHRLTLEALEEYRRTGESVDAGPVLDAFVANVRRRVADKR
jgi:hypothetical protein